jgi:hypothetical protein
VVADETRGEIRGDELVGVLAGQAADARKPRSLRSTQYCSTGRTASGSSRLQAVTLILGRSMKL